MPEYDAPGLPRSQTVRAMASVGRWGLTPRQRQSALDFLQEVIDAPDVPVRTKIGAVECLLKADALNLAAEKAMEPVDSGDEKRQVVLLLPPNGTEKQA